MLPGVEGENFYFVEDKYPHSWTCRNQGVDAEPSFLNHHHPKSSKNIRI